MAPSRFQRPRAEHAQDSRLLAGRCPNLVRTQLLKNTLAEKTVAVVLLAVVVLLFAVGVVLLAVVVLVWWVLVGPRGQWHPLPFVRLVVALLLVGFCGG